MIARLTDPLLACALAAPALADPPKVPLFGRHSGAAAPAPAAAPPAAPAAPADAGASRRYPVTAVAVPPAAAAPEIAAAPAAATPEPPTETARLRAAYVFALPVFEMMRARHLQVSKVEALGAPGVNHLYARTTLADAHSRDVTTPNNDTLYSSAWLDLAGGPVILDTPALPGRYHSVALMDLFTNNVAIVGTRTGGKGGRYLIAGPGWNGTPPPQTTVLRSPTNDAWLLVRVLVNGPDDLATATGLIRGFSLAVPPENAKPVPVTAVPTADPDAATFLAVVDEAAARNRVGKDIPQRPEWTTLGLIPGGPPAGPAGSVGQGPPALHAEVATGLAQAGTVIDGWSYPGAGIGAYGDSDDLARARVALGGLGALPRTEAIYLTAVADKAGAPLTGTRAYTAHIPGHLPVGAILVADHVPAGSRRAAVLRRQPVEALRGRRPDRRPSPRTRRRLRHLHPADPAVGRARGQLAAVVQGPLRPHLPRLSARPGAARRQSPPAAGRAERPHPVTAGQCAGSGAVAAIGGRSAA